MLDNVRRHLEEKGIDPTVLDDYADVENAVDEPVVEVDALTEAIDELAKAMKKEPKEEPKEKLFDMDDEVEDDDDLERGMYFEDAMKALAKGTDDVIANMEKRMCAVMKGLETVLSEMKKMKMGNEAMEKSLNSVLNTTSAPRAVTSAPVVAAEPAQTAPNRGDMIRKGLTLLQDSDVESSRKIQIRTAIAQLEAGVSPNSVSHIIK
tara:strand:- start:7771 stop:8391 length:621 start_codon:yes stop_codon:yes gene_type:complete